MTLRRFRLRLAEWIAGDDYLVISHYSLDELLEIHAAMAEMRAEAQIALPELFVKRPATERMH